MELNEIKKTLYKEKPIAIQTGIMRDGGSRTYQAETSLGTVKFFVPVGDMKEWNGNPKQESEFNKMPAQLLIKWIKND